MSNAILSWRNWAAEYGTLSEIDGAWEAGAPSANLLNPRTSDLAIRDGFGITSFEVAWPEGRPVSLLGLLNHNIVQLQNTGDIVFSVTDSGSNAALIQLPSGVVPSAEFQSHIILPVTEDNAPDVNLEDIIRIAVTISSTALTGTLDPYTTEYTAAPLQAGVLWAGPMWQPIHGLRFDAFGQGVNESIRRARSIGGQVFASPEKRFRTLSAEFTLLSEKETYSIRQFRSKLLAQPTLQQLAAWCGASRPLIVVPTDTDADLIYAQGIYGYLDNPIQWALADSAYDPTEGEKARSYRASFSMSEAL